MLGCLDDLADFPCILKGLSHCALTMDYNYDEENPKRSILLWGDTSGSIVIIRFYENPSTCLFSTPRCNFNRISLVRLLFRQIPDIRTVILRQLHGDWVQQVRYFVNKKVNVLLEAAE